MIAPWLIGRHEVFPDRNEIRREGAEPTSIEPRTMRVLMYLVEHAGRVVSVRELLDAVWKDVIVTQDSVYTSIASLRRALGDDGDANRLIVNVPRRGYQLVATVRRPDASPEAAQSRDPPAGAPSGTVASVAPATPAAASALRGPPTGRWRPLLGVVAIVLLGLGLFAASQRMRDAPRATPAALSLAVLPFSDLSDKQDQQYFADGLAEEILNELEHIPGLKVIGRASSFQFRGDAQDVRRVGSALGAAYLLKGSVRRAADRIRVSAELVAASDGAYRWSNTYEVSTPDVFKLQDSISADLARYLKLTVADIEPERNRMRPEVYDLYLRAAQLIDSLTEENVTRGVATLEEAARIEPKSARIHSTLAIGYGALLFQGWAPAAEAFAAAKRHAEIALQLDPANGVAHAALGAVTAEYEWNWARARAEIDEALRLEPVDPWVLFLAASVYAVPGDWSRARQLSEDLLAIDPLSQLAEFALGARVLLRRGDFIGAEKHLRRAIQIRAGYETLRYFLAMALMGQGRAAEALERIREACAGGRSRCHRRHGTA